MFSNFIGLLGATVIEAQERGFEAEFITDATGSLPYANEAGKATAEEIHRIFSVVMQSSFAATITTNEWINVIENNKLAKRSNIYLSNQQAKIKK